MPGQRRGWLWDFDEEPHLPQASTIESLLPAVDYTQLSLQEDGTAALRSSSSALDLGAVGKGAACDAAVAAYQEAGVERAVVSVGGSVGVYGDKPFGQKWQVSVRNPDTDGALGVLSVSSGFLSTSGSYEKQFTEDGVTYHHLLEQFDSQALFITQERQIYLTSGLEDAFTLSSGDYTLAGTV